MKTKVSKAFKFQLGQKLTKHYVDETAEKDGDLITAIMSEARRDKAEKKLPLNAPIKNLIIYAGNEETAVVIRQGCIDIAATLKVENIKVLAEKHLKAEKSVKPKFTSN